MNALIYSRVSTDEQAEEGLSIDTQINRCRNWAGENDYNIVGVYKDEGKSATNMNRAGLQDLLVRAQEKGNIDAILVLDTDRLARNTLDHLTIKSLLQKAGVKLISISQLMIDDSPEGNLIDTIIASVNAFQSQITGRKVSKVAEEKAKAGFYPSKARLGYINTDNPKPAGKFDQKVLALDSERASYLSQAFKLYSTGNFSIKTLVEHLYELGLRSNTGVKVCTSVLGYCLQDPLYIGKFIWKETLYQGHHPVIIDEQTFNQCQEVMAAHNQNASRQRKHNYLLRGYVYCADCSRRLWAEQHVKKSGAIFEYYFCKTCGKDSYISVGDLEEQVEEWFSAIQITKAYAEDIIEQAKIILENFRDNSDNETQILTNRQSKLEAAMREAEDKWLIQKTLSDEAFRRIYERYEADLKSIKKQLNQMVANNSKALKTVQRLMALAEDIGLAYYEAEPALKRFYLGLFWEKFLVKKGKIVDAALSQEVKDLLQKPPESSSKQRMAPRPGLEPGTFSLTANCSTIELSRNIKLLN